MSTEQRQHLPRYAEVGWYVHSSAARLLRLRTTGPGAAAMAHLRAAVTSEPGTDPVLWSWTIDGVPGNATTDEPSHQERAVHAAMTLLAVHQQSRPDPMDKAGVGLGHAAAQLDLRRGGTGDGGSPVRRRLDAAVTSSSFEELVHHLRGLVGLLRSEGIGLDYGLLADDLDQFQRPAGSNAVRRRWVRQLYARSAGEAPAADHVEPQGEIA